MSLTGAVEVPPRDREVLQGWLRSPSIRAGLAQRARIVLLAADGAAACDGPLPAGRARQYCSPACRQDEHPPEAWRHGLWGVVVPEIPRKFDPEFREGAVRIVRETKKPIAVIARSRASTRATLGNGSRRTRRGVRATARSGSRMRRS